DAELPGGGWPRRALSELLLPHPGIGEIRLLAPSLIAAQRAGRLVMIFDPPAALSASALARLGFDVDELLVVNTRARLIPGSDSLWALEQALKSGHVGAVLAWLPPRLRAERLRRLQLAAHNHDGAAFVMREAAAAVRPTASPLRLGLQASGADRLQVRVLKRRGPPLEAPLQLALSPVLSGAARRRAESEPPFLHTATFVNFA
ncbi:MAG: translesion DNA synthesis-associated protein ImuA, partial [Caldimonas sp.]